MARNKTKYYEYYDFIIYSKIIQNLTWCLFIESPCKGNENGKFDDDLEVEVALAPLTENTAINL